MTSPLVGVTASREHVRWGVWQRHADLLPARYADAILRAGGVPVLLPPTAQAAASAVPRLDALVLAGGADVEPARYNAAPHPELGPTRPDRDAAEFAALAAALDCRMPVLGICRGAQVLNVALGGDLLQHLPDVVGSVAHRPAPATYGRTDVRVAPGSRLASILSGRVRVDCYHHQALRRLGDGLEPVGWASDGTVEAVELAHARFVVGVQWHPEQGDDGGLFSAMVAAAG